MDKKELYSMTKLRGLFLALGLTALLGLSAREVNAETLTITVSYGGSDYTFTGTSNGVTVPDNAINNDLNGSGYSFSSLGGTSNYPGSSGAVGGYITDSGTLSYSSTDYTSASGATITGGPGGVLTITITESGFTSPASGSGMTLVNAPTSDFSGTGAGGTTPLTPTYQQDTGTYKPDNGATTSTPTTTMVSNGTASDDHSDSSSTGVGPYVTSYTLTIIQTVDLTQRSTSVAADAIGGKVSLVTVPEPASLIMMVTGMPLPLVVMGLLRRRRAAA
jgi:hypothetical protein